MQEQLQGDTASISSGKLQLAPDAHLAKFIDQFGPDFASQAANSQLAGQTFSLANGGQLIPK